MMDVAISCGQSVDEDVGVCRVQQVSRDVG